MNALQDKDQIKDRLLDYLTSVGNSPNSQSFIKCENPGHRDEPPYDDAHITPDGQYVHCFACHETYDIFQIEMWRSGHEFKAAINLLGDRYGHTGSSPVPDSHTTATRNRVAQSPTALSTVSQKEAVEIFSTTVLSKWCQGNEVQGIWFAKDEEGKVFGADVRYDSADEQGKIQKIVLSFRLGPSGVTPKGVPSFLFGRDLLAQSPELPVLVVEGAKCWSAAQSIDGFVPVTWNRGAESASKAPWEPLRGRKVYILPDNDKPGRKASEAIRERLEDLDCEVLVCGPFPCSTGNGFDIYDALQIITPEEVKGWILHGSKESASVIPETPVSRETPKTLPFRIDTGDRNIVQASTHAWKAIQAKNDPPSLFQRDRRIVRLSPSNASGFHLDPVDSATLRHELNRCIEFYRTRVHGRQINEEADRAYPELSEDMLAYPSYPLPFLKRVNHAPFFGPNGNLVSQPGYDQESCTYLVDQCLGEIRADLDLQSAVDFIKLELFSDFPFDPSDGSSLATAFSTLLQPFVRDLIKGPIPLVLIDASNAGSGKGLLANVLSIPAFWNASDTIPSQADEAEFQKAIFSSMLKGSSRIIIDNVKHHVDSAFFEAVLTSTTYQGRILGQSKTANIDVQNDFLMTGNNATLSEDLIRRTERIRLVPDTDAPESRQGFRHPDLIAWTTANRRAVVEACLSIIQSWVSSGMKKHTGSVKGSFEAWSQVMGGILKHAGIEGFLEGAQKLKAESSPDRENTTLFVQGWFMRYEERPIVVKDLLEIAKALNNFPPKYTKEKAGTAYSMAVAREIQKLSQRVFRIDSDIGAILVSVEKDGKEHSAQQWALKIKEAREKK